MRPQPTRQCQQRPLAITAWWGYPPLMDKAQIEAAIRAFVDDALEGPLGPIPIHRVVVHHLALFDELRRVGVPWESIAKRFASEGIDHTAKWWRTAYSNSSSRARQRQTRAERAPAPESGSPPPRPTEAAALQPPPRDPYAPRAGQGLESIAGTRLPRPKGSGGS